MSDDDVPDPRSFPDQVLFDALDSGVTEVPSRLVPGEAVIAATGRWGDLGSIVVLWRDDEDEQYLCNDTYLLARSPAGAWESPGGCSGSAMPEWVLQRPSRPLPSWRGHDIVDLPGELAGSADGWLTDLTLMATLRVATVEVGWGVQRISVAVPASGLVTLPARLDAQDQRATYDAFDAAGTLVSSVEYRPLTELDAAMGFPDDGTAGGLYRLARAMDVEVFPISPERWAALIDAPGGALSTEVSKASEVEAEVNRVIVMALGEARPYRLLSDRGEPWTPAVARAQVRRRADRGW